MSGNTCKLMAITFINCYLILNISSECTDHKNGIKLTGFGFVELLLSHIATSPSVLAAYNLCVSCVKVKLKDKLHCMTIDLKISKTFAYIHKFTKIQSLIGIPGVRKNH